MHAKERSQEAEEGKRLGSEPSERGGGEARERSILKLSTYMQAAGPVSPPPLARTVLYTAEANQ